jgi:hypothetical protein
MTTVARLIGVYNADGTVRGELAYWIGARFGRAHCALCDITHGVLRERADWQSCQAGLPVPFDTFHRDDQPAAVRHAVEGRVPVVVAETEDGSLHLLLDGRQLDECDGSPDVLVAAVRDAAAAAGLGWPGD